MADLFTDAEVRERLSVGADLETRKPLSEFAFNRLLKKLAARQPDVSFWRKLGRARMFTEADVQNILAAVANNARPAVPAAPSPTISPARGRRGNGRIYVPPPQ